MSLSTPFRLSAICVIVFTVLMLVACESTQEFDTHLIPEDQKKAHEASVAKAKACPVSLVELIDVRTPKDLLVGNEKVSADTLYNLLEMSLEETNISHNISSNNSIKVVLKRAFVKSIGSNMIATVVLDTMYRPHYADKFFPAASFKGRSVNVNVNTESDENVAKTAMKAAFDDAIKRIKASLLHECGEALSLNHKTIGNE